MLNPHLVAYLFVIIGSFSRENGHPLCICSSPSSAFSVETCCHVVDDLDCCRFLEKLATPLELEPHTFVSYEDLGIPMWNHRGTSAMEDQFVLRKGPCQKGKLVFPPP